MKTIKIIFFICLIPQLLWAQQAKKQLENSLKQVRSKQYQTAASNLFNLSRKKDIGNLKQEVKYWLGVSLMEMGYHQVAAFQFIDVIQSGDVNFKKKAVQKLTKSADELGDDTILNYALTKVEVEDFPASEKDMLYFRLGEAKLKANDFKGAVEFFDKIPSSSMYYDQAKFQQGIAFMEAGQMKEAESLYRRLLNGKKSAPINDNNKVALQMALARVLYQKQDWNEAVKAYSNVPRDTEFWHEALFEQTWAMLRANRLRSALSNFQSLHSEYYNDFYIPETLLLRSIVYLYICKNEELEKVLTLFEKSYTPMKNRIVEALKAEQNADALYVDLEKANFQRIKKEPQKTNLPYIVLRHILREGDVKRSIYYLKKLTSERKSIESSALGKSSFGKYASKILTNRLTNAKKALGEQVKDHLSEMNDELTDLLEQGGLIKYEMINAKKEVIKKKLSGEKQKTVPVEDRDREFYVKNGFQFYPFQGEYWLDEIGNYHYLGKSSCE